MKRTKKNTSALKTKSIQVRLTDDLYGILSQDARGARLSVSEYVRMLLMGKRPIIQQEVIYNDPRILQAFGDLDIVGVPLARCGRHDIAAGGVSGDDRLDLFKLAGIGEAAAAELDDLAVHQNFRHIETSFQR